MRYTPSGKPLCCRCRKVATHRTPYRSKNDAGKYEICHSYCCQAHAHEGLSVLLPPIETVKKHPVIAMYDVVRYHGYLYRVVGISLMRPYHLIPLRLRRIGPGNSLRNIDVRTSVFYPQVTLVKPYTSDWHVDQRVLSVMESRAYYHIIAARCSQ